MGRVIKLSEERPHAIEHTLPWGPVIRGVRWGQGDDRVLFLHEPASDIDAWQSMPSHIALALQVETCAFDLLGHGLSDDPWEPERLHETLLFITEEDDRTGRLLIVAAGDSAFAALEYAAEQDVVGLVCLSPPPPDAERRAVRSPRVPKLFFAGSGSGDDVLVTRQLAADLGGWSVVTAVPVDARGTDLLRSDWAPRIVENTIAFVRDCLHPRRPKAGQVPIPIQAWQG